MGDRYMLNRSLDNAIMNSPLFEGVDQHTVSSIAGSLAEESWSKGQLIMGAADSIESFRLVIEGRVKIVRSNSHDGHELTLWLLGPGDGFDIVSLLDGKPHAVTAWAVDNVVTKVAPMSSWHEWLEQSRPLRLAAHHYIADKLREIGELAGDLGLHETSARLAHLLLRHFGSTQGNLLRDLPQREIASMIGSVRIVVSRLLAEMRRQGVVDLHGGAVRAVDLKRLLVSAESELAHGKVPARVAKVRTR
jgi:CRP/FNR family transcriptional regulator, cyclic AMP receptor protein